MPLYEYRCQACGAVQECLIGKPEEEKELKCLNCGSANLSKLISRPNILSGCKEPPKQEGAKKSNGQETQNQGPFETKTIPATLHLPGGDKESDVIQISLCQTKKPIIGH